MQTGNRFIQTPDNTLVIRSAQIVDSDGVGQANNRDFLQWRDTNFMSEWHQNGRTKCKPNESGINQLKVNSENTEVKVPKKRGRKPKIKTDEDNQPKIPKKRKKQKSDKFLMKFRA